MVPSTLMSAALLWSIGQLLVIHHPGIKLAVIMIHCHDKKISPSALEQIIYQLIYRLPRCISGILQIKSVYQAERFDIWNIIRSNTKINLRRLLLEARN